MKFIHAADLHIDSPLRGLERYDGAPVERLRGATRAALENLVQLALDERVEFVVIAGDLFDRSWRDMSTGLWTADQLRRLDREDIRVYLIRGNHDSANEVQAAIRWPACVREFSVDAPETIVDEEAGVALHGQGFARREVPEDLAAGYPQAVRELFNIGVLHTSLTGTSKEHDTYAPTSPDALAAKGYDYWALGHVHQREIIRQDPWIVFSGNTQGRHVRETEAKGCFLVTVDGGRVATAEFRSTDVLRWYRLDVELEHEDGEDELLDKVRQRLETCREVAAGRLAAVRLEVHGACRAASVVHGRAGQERVIAEIRNTANDVGDVWLEKVRLDLAPPVARGDVLAGKDLAAGLARVVESALARPESLAELATALEPLAKKHAPVLREAGVDLEDTAAVARWLGAAEERLLSGLWEGES